MIMKYTIIRYAHYTCLRARYHPSLYQSGHSLLPNTYAQLLVYAISLLYEKAKLKLQTAMPMHVKSQGYLSDMHPSNAAHHNRQS